MVSPSSANVVVCLVSVYVLTLYPCIRLVLKVERSSFPATASGQGSDQTYTAKVTAHREVSESGLLHVFVQVCPADMGTSALKIDGDLTFRNPYGYLPVSYDLVVLAVMFTVWVTSGDLHPSPQR